MKRIAEISFCGSATRSRPCVKFTIFFWYLLVAREGPSRRTCLARGRVAQELAGHGRRPFTPTPRSSSRAHARIRHHRVALASGPDRSLRWPCALPSDRSLLQRCACYKHCTKDLAHLDAMGKAATAKVAGGRRRDECTGILVALKRSGLRREKLPMTHRNPHLSTCAASDFKA
jgi:hypothetical protein